METVNTPNTNLQNYFDSLKSKTDIIIKAAQHAEINQQNSLASTALLNRIMTNGNGGAMVGIAFLLSVQSSYLPEGCSDAFVVVTRSFFEVSSKDQIMAAHKEGSFCKIRYISCLTVSFSITSVEHRQQVDIALLQQWKFKSYYWNTFEGVKSYGAVTYMFDARAQLFPTGEMVVVLRIIIWSAQ